jgi:general secretion pathway protein N
MSRASVWAIVGALLGGSVAAVLWWPASSVQPWLAQATQQRVQWVHTRGSIWQGQTQWRLTGGEGAGDAHVLPGTWSWRLRPAWRNGPALDLDIAASCCLDQDLRVRLQLSDWRQAEWSLNDVRLRLPLDVLRGLGTPWNTLQLQGQLQVQSAGLSGRANAVQGQVTLNTEQVASRLSTVRPLGDYEATITWPPQELPQVKLRTLDGHLRLQGQGQIAQGRLRFRGQASASPDSAGALSNLLNIIGRRQGAISILTIG